MSDLMMALTELRDAQPCYEEAEEYYEGTADEKYASDAMRRLLTGSRTGFTINMAARPVDAVLDRMEIAAVTTDPEQHTTVLQQQVWDANDLDIEAPEIHLRTCSLGDAYLYVGLSDEPENPDLEDDTGPGRTVDMFYNSPTTVRIIYDTEHPRRKKLAIKSWCEKDEAGKDRTRVNLYYPDRIEKWVSKPNTKGVKEQDFERYADDSTDDNGDMVNETGRIPFFHFRTRRPYGTPVHKNAFGPQDALTKLVINQMAASDFAAFPQRYTLAEPGVGTDDDTDWGDDDATDPEARESSLISGPGQVWQLRNIKAAGEFTPVDVKNFLEPMGTYVRFMAATTTTPLRWFDPSGDVPSGESIRADEAPLVKKVEALERAFAATWGEACEYALELLGVNGVTVMVQWAPTQTIDDLEGWQAVQAQQAAGVPVRQSLIEHGYTDTQVEEWGYTEQEPDGPNNLGDMMRAGEPPQFEVQVETPAVGGL